MPPSWSEKDPALVAAAKELGVWPLDEHNAVLLDAVHPRKWDGPSDADAVAEYDLIAIGAGGGGLISAKQSARRGARSALISGHLAGGDCLNVGCVPSKGLLHCMKATKEARAAFTEGFVVGKGTAAPDLSVDFGAVMRRMRKLRAKIAPADSHEGTVGAGAHCFQGYAKFVGPNEVEVNGRRLRFKKAVIATGGKAAVPDTPGLRESPYITNESIFNLTKLPPRLVTLGSGVIALEMAQCFAVFGSKVTVLVRGERLLPREDADVAAVMQKALEKDGVRFLFKAKLSKVSSGPADKDGLAKFALSGTVGGAALAEECDALLVSTGRVPNVTGLGLEAAGIEASPKDGVYTNDLLQTKNPAVFAIGDCAAGVPRLTHASGEMAKLAVQNALFDDEWKMSSMVIPQCTYTEPELAGVGLTPYEAQKKGIELDTYVAGLEHNDRSILDGEEFAGMVKIYTAKGTDKIVGATICASRAGEMINELTLAMKEGIGLEAIGRTVHCYPTIGEGVMQAGLAYIRTKWGKLPKPPPPPKPALEPTKLAAAAGAVALLVAVVMAMKKRA